MAGVQNTSVYVKVLGKNFLYRHFIHFVHRYPTNANEKQQKITK